MRLVVVTEWAEKRNERACDVAERMRAERILVVLALLDCGAEVASSAVC
jgi:hypothetical protein